MGKKKCYIYTRVSTAAQIEGYSLEAQEKRLKDYADYKELEVAGEYCDAGCSGHSIKGRPEFQRMLDDIVGQRDDISFVLVFKLSRFGRNAADVLKSMQLLTDYGVDLICVEDAIDSSTQGGRLTLSILSAVAEIERENISIQFHAGQMQRLKGGKWPGGPAPYGYRIIDKNLVIDEAEARIVKLIYELYLRDEMTANSVATYLNAHGYHRMVKGEPSAFKRDMIVFILKNPVYCGQIQYNRRTNDKSPNRKPKDVIVVQGIHQPIVSESVWMAAQKKLKQNYRPREKIDNPDRISLLSGLVKCPKCGSSMVAIKNKRKNKNHGGYYKILYHYKCMNHRSCNGRTCDFSGQYNQEKLDQAVLERVNGLSATNEFREEIMQQLGSRCDVASIEDTMKTLRKKINSLEARSHKLGECMDHLDILDESYDAQYESLQNEMDAVYDEIEQTESELEKWQSRYRESRLGVHAEDNIVKVLKNWDRIYGYMTDEERREMYRSFIDHIDVFPDYSDGKMLKGIAFSFPMMDAAGNEDEVQYYLDCSHVEMTNAEKRTKGTYAQIKSYIQEKFGAKVSSLYIAQIKDRCGLEKRDCYNFSKKENARVPNCPPAKAEMILDALKHFKLVGEDMQITEEGETDES